MIVCICHRVSDRDIAHAVREGCGSFDELKDSLRVATGCGACDDCARETFDAHRGVGSQVAHVVACESRRAVRTMRLQEIAA